MNQPHQLTYIPYSTITISKEWPVREWEHKCEAFFYYIRKTKTYETQEDIVTPRANKTRQQLNAKDIDEEVFQIRDLLQVKV